MALALTRSCRNCSGCPRCRRELADIMNMAPAQYAEWLANHTKQTAATVGMKIVAHQQGGPVMRSENEAPIPLGIQGALKAARLARGEQISEPQTPPAFKIARVDAPPAVPVEVTFMSLLAARRGGAR